MTAADAQQQQDRANKWRAQQVAERFSRPHPNGAGYKADCPVCRAAHAVRIAFDPATNRVALKCYGEGCDPDLIRADLGLTEASLIPKQIATPVGDASTIDGETAFVPYIPFVPLLHLDAIVPSFPLETLPEPLRTLVADGAKSLPSPLEFVGLPVLVAASAAIGNRCKLMLTASYEQQPVLWGAVVGRPGTKKTPAIKLAMRGLQTLQNDAYDQWSAELATYKQAMAEWESAKGQDKGPEPIKPKLTHYLTTNATVEALAPILEGAAGVLVFRDELPGWVASFDQYHGGKGADRAAMLEFWSASSQKIDRKSADPITVKDPNVCVVGGVQWAMLAKLRGEADQEDGFFDRFLWVAPQPMRSRWTRLAVSKETFRKMTDLYQTLRTGVVPERIWLSPRADALYGLWYETNAEKVQSRTGLQAGMYVKAEAHAARLALVLHAVQHAEQPQATQVSLATMADALRLMEFFRAHGNRVAAFMKAQGHSARSLKGRLIAALGEAEWLNTKDLWGKVGRGIDRNVFRDALNELCAEGVVEGRRPQRDGPGRRGEQWRLVPLETEIHPITPMEQKDLKEEIADYAEDCIDIDGLLQLMGARKAAALCWCGGALYRYAPDGTPYCEEHAPPSGEPIEENV